MEGSGVSNMQQNTLTHAGSLRDSWHKFRSLPRKKIATGDPDCPPEVHHAKRIVKEMEEKMDAAVDADDEENCVPDPISSTHGVTGKILVGPAFLTLKVDGYYLCQA